MEKSILPVLELIHTGHHFPDPSGSVHNLIQGVSLTLKSAEDIAVTGPSGSGKTTLLRIAGSLLSPAEGTVRICGQNPYTLNDSQLSILRRTTLGFVFQQHCLLQQLTALENALLPFLAAANTVPEEASVRVKELFRLAGMDTRMHSYPENLSGGECQKTAVIRALAPQPKLLLADEPTGSLDRKSADIVAGFFFDLAAHNGCATFIMTHDLHLAKRCAGNARLENGRLQL